MICKPALRHANRLALVLVIAVVATTACKDKKRTFIPPSSSPAPAPQTPSSFSAAGLPKQLDAGGAPGNAALALNGDLLVAGRATGKVFRVARATGAVTEDLVDAGEDITAIYCDDCDVAGVTYAGTAGGGGEVGQIWSKPALPPNSPWTPFADLAVNETPTAITKVPNAFGGLQVGRLAISTTDGAGGGQVLTIEPGDESMRGSLGVPGPSSFLDLEFGPSATLYVLDASAKAIVSRANSGATGVVVEVGLLGTLVVPAGMAVDEANNRFFIVDDSADSLVSIDRTSKARTTIGQANLFEIDSVFATGLIWEGVRNVLMVTAGSSVARAATLPAFNLASPAAISGTDRGFGGFALDREGNLIGLANRTGSANSVFRIRRDTGAISTIAEGIGAAGERLLAAVYHLETDSIYVGTDAAGTGSDPGKVYKIDSGNVVTELAALVGPVGPITGLAIGPEGFRPSGVGKIIYATSEGAVGEISTGGTVVQYQGATAGQMFTALVFTSDGTGIVADHQDGSLRKLDKVTGNPGAGFSTLTRPTGLAISPNDDTFVYIADEGQGRILRARVDNGAGSVVAQNLMFEPAVRGTGMAADGLGNLLYGSGTGSLTVTQIALPALP